MKLRHFKAWASRKHSCSPRREATPSSPASGLVTGGINRRATALLWMAGENSLVDDVRFEGGHGGLARERDAGQFLRTIPTPIRHDVGTGSIPAFG